MEPEPRAKIQMFTRGQGQGSGVRGQGEERGQVRVVREKRG